MTETKKVRRYRVLSLETCQQLTLTAATFKPSTKCRGSRILKKAFLMVFHQMPLKRVPQTKQSLCTITAKTKRKSWGPLEDTSSSSGLTLQSKSSPARTQMTYMTLLRGQQFQVSTSKSQFVTLSRIEQRMMIQKAWALLRRRVVSSLKGQKMVVNFSLFKILTILYVVILRF